MEHYKKIIKVSLLIAGIIILILFVRNISIKTIFSSLEALGTTKIILLLGLTFLNIIVKAVRWKLLTARISGTKIPFWFSFSSILAGVAGSSFIPGKIELAKPLMNKTNYNIKISYSLSALAVERILDLLTLLIIATISLFFIPVQSIIPNYIIFTSITLLIIGTLFLILFPNWFIFSTQKIFLVVLRILHKDELRTKINEFITTIFQGFSVLKEKVFVIFITMLSITANMIEVIRFYILMQFLGIGASIAITGFAFTIAIIIGVITTIPGGVGMTELSAGEILTNFLTTIPQGLINSAILIDRFIAYYLLVIIGALMLVFYDKIFKNNLEIKNSPEVHKLFKAL